jgi:hypothetical protein
MIEASLELELVNCYHPHMDLSSGYEAVAIHFLARRGGAPSIGIGANVVRKWARKLPIGSCVFDLGCGPGFPITAVLVEEGLRVFERSMRRHLS